MFQVQNIQWLPLIVEFLQELSLFFRLFVLCLAKTGLVLFYRNSGVALGNCAIFVKTIILEKLLEITLQNRKILYKYLTETPREQLLRIPEGFNNSIWWNIAHVVVTQQLLVYQLSKQQMRVEDGLVDKFKKGTKPDGTATEEEIKKIANYLISTVEWTKEDLENGLFKEYNEYTTSANVTLTNVSAAMAFNVFHEGIHLGAILALKKVV